MRGAKGRVRSAALAIGLAEALLACNALFDDASQCAWDRDCARFGANAVCSAEGSCVIASTAAREKGTPPVSAAQSGGASEAAASLSIAPAAARLLGGRRQSFSVTMRGADGVPIPQPSVPVEWSVSGGGAVDETGVFVAGAEAGGPFTLTARSGELTATAIVSVTVASVKLGETTVLAVDDSGNGDLLLAQKASLGEPATVQHLSFYVSSAVGKLRLGLYDATGPDGLPGAKVAETPEIVPIVGWNTADVTAPILVPAGSYWLAYAPSSSELHFNRAGDGGGAIAFYAQPYGPLPQTFSTTPSTVADRWSLYASLSP